MGNNAEKRENTEPLWTAPFIEVILISFFSSMSYFLVHTLITSFAQSFGAELAAAGAAVGSFSISAMIIRPFSGFFSDRLNKKTLVVVTTAALALCLASYAFCTSVPMLFVIRIIHGVAFGVNGTATLALAVEQIPKSRTGEGLGFYGVGAAASQIAGPPLGLFLKDLIGYQWMFFSDAAFLLLSGLVFLLIFRYRKPAAVAEQKGLFPHTPGKNRFLEILNSLIAKEAIFYALMGGLFSMGNNVVNGFMVTLGESRGIANISYFFTVNAITLFVLRMTLGKALDRVKLSILVAVSMVTSALSMALIGWAGGLVPILLSSVIKGFGNVGGQVALQSACVKRVDPARVGIATSTYYIGADIGTGLGPVWAGAVAQKFGIVTPFYVMAAIFILGSVVFVVYEATFAKRFEEKRAALKRREEGGTDGR